MSDTNSLPPPPDLCETVFSACEDKAGLPLSKMIILGMLAGIYIGFGGLFATVALAGADSLPFGVAQILAGTVFSLGLALVMVAGAELFTGNTLMIGPVVAGRIPAGRAAGALTTVYLANFAGSIALAVVAVFAGLHEAGDGAVGRAAFELAETKTAKGFATTLASGILANKLVCLGVWLAYAGHTVTQKIFGLLLPVAAFVAAGFEHSIANMYLLTYATLVQGMLEPSTALLDISDIFGNLLPATIGNVIGGAFVALAYSAAYGKPAKK
ncbi:formate/nitrite transporter family protein [Neorhizobium sp. AL 9.2.2]|uniref:formate/nitrite transporter family protein n=1 Tax=Neorhizobium sp. AL 9.2.2 TaxID=2712894 RepID=UPI0015747488|nr:formate/nitrite transporter family protein [Neorhizobium sp. AL 9.2.2]NSY17349.1 formate/nitrite transporter family protein [Neorhizobium sp. AL 9.2.2]